MTKILDVYYDELVDLIYQIPLASTAWVAFAQKIIEILDASYVHIQAIDFSYNVLSYSRGEGILPLETYAQAEMSYLHYPKDADPRWDQFLNPERKGWYQCHTHVSQDFVNQSDLYQNILLPIGLRYVASHELVWDEKLCVFWSVSTSADRQPLNSDELAFLDRLTTHLKRVVAIQRHLYEFSAKALVGYAVIDKLSQPIVLLNLSAQIVHANKSANMFMYDNDVVKILDNKIELPHTYQKHLIESLYQIEASFRQKQDIVQHSLKDGEFKHEVRQFEKSYDNQQAEQISLMV